MSGTNDDGLEGAKKYTKSVFGEFEESFKSNFEIDKIYETMAKVEASAAEVAKSFGQGREQITAIKAGMADAYTSVALLGGGFDDIVTLQKDAATQLGRNVILTSESYEKLYATANVTGRSNKELIEGFKNAGFSLYDVSNQMQKVMDSARELGVNAQAVSKQVVENMSKMNQFNFQGGVDGMAKMAAQAVNLRVDMAKTLDIAKGLFQPEKAIEMAAAMQRLGVAQGDLLDPLKLMDLAQNDPAELQNQIAQMSKQFTQLNADGHFEIMPGAKRQLMEIGEELGFRTGELERMALSGAELEQKMGKIKFPEFATKEQQEMLANITEMGANGDMKINVEGEEMDINAAMEKFGTSPESFEKLIEASRPKTMEELAEQQLSTQKLIETNIAAIARTGYGMARTKVGTQAEDAMRTVAKKTTQVLGGESLSSKNIGKVVGGGIENFITSVNNGTPFLEALATAAQGAETFFRGTFKEVTDNTAKSIKELGESTNPLLQFFVGTVKKGVETFAEHEKITTPVSPPSNTEIKVNDFVIKTLDTDKFVMGGGTNPMGNNSDVASKNMGPIDINLNIKVDAPGMDTSQLLQAFNNPDVQKAITTAAGTAANTANGIGEPNPNTEARKQYTT
jgi:hypothetical protein